MSLAWFKEIPIYFLFYFSVYCFIFLFLHRKNHQQVKWNLIIGMIYGQSFHFLLFVSRTKINKFLWIPSLLRYLIERLREKKRAKWIRLFLFNGNYFFKSLFLLYNWRSFDKEKLFLIATKEGGLHRKMTFNFRHLKTSNSK